MFAYICSSYFNMRSIKSNLILILFLITIAFAHPLSLFPLVFMLIFFRIIKIKEISNVLYVYIICLFVWFLILKKVLFSSDYESNTSLRLIELLFETPDYIVMSFVWLFLESFKTYHFIVISLVVIFYVFLSKRLSQELRFFTLFLIGFIFITGVAFADYYNWGFYLENAFAPLSIIIGCPLIWFFLVEKNYSKAKTIAFSVLLIISILRIYDASSFYKKRIQWERNFINQYGSQKYIFPDLSHEMNSKLVISWNFTYEAWLLSTIENNKSVSVFPEAFMDRIKNVNNNNSTHLFYTWEGAVEYKKLNPLYFKFSDTSSNYTVLNIDSSGFKY